MSSSKRDRSVAAIEITKGLEPVFSRHIKRVASHLRQADINELSAIETRTPYEEVLHCCETSSMKWIIVEQIGNLYIPIALFGVVTDEKDENAGIPWMVATDSLKNIKMFMARNSRRYIDIMLKTYSHLYNYVDERNQDSIKWLKWCGFQFGEVIPVGDAQLPFHRFDMRRP